MRANSKRFTATSFILSALIGRVAHVAPHPSAPRATRRCEGRTMSALGSDGEVDTRAARGMARSKIAHH